MLMCKSETPSRRQPRMAREKRCLDCPKMFTVRGANHQRCDNCARIRNNKRTNESTKRWRAQNTTYRTQVRSEYRRQEDKDWGRVVYLHRDPLSKQIVYVGSGTITRARSCRRGGGFQRSPEHVEWYKTHRRLGTIQSYHDFVEVLHRNIETDAEMLRLEGEETLRALVDGDLFNKMVPNPKRLLRTPKDIVRHFKQLKPTV